MGNGQSFKLDASLEPLNFGAKSLEFKLLLNTKYVPQKESIDITPELVGEPSDDLWQLRDYIPNWEIHKMQRINRRGNFRIGGIFRV